MDLEKGLKRLTLALSVLAVTCVGIYLVATNEAVAIIVFLIVFIFLEVISAFIVRNIYRAIRWVVKRFRTDKPKDEEDSKQILTTRGNLYN